MFERLTDLDSLRPLGPGLYAVAGIASFIECLFPPLPGDTLILASAFLAGALTLSLPGIWLATTLGALLGGGAAWWIGCRIGKDPAHWPLVLRRPRIIKGVERVERVFDRYGAILLLSNRFVPVSRAFFFLGAGVSGLRVWEVSLWGGLSAAVWNYLLIYVAASLGKNWSEVVDFFRAYAFVSISLVVALAFSALAIWWLRRRKNR